MARETLKVANGPENDEKSLRAKAPRARRVDPLERKTPLSRDRR